MADTEKSWSSVKISLTWLQVWSLFLHDQHSKDKTTTNIAINEEFCILLILIKLWVKRNCIYPTTSWQGVLVTKRSKMQGKSAVLSRWWYYWLQSWCWWKSTSSDWKKAVSPVLICQTEANALIAFFSWMLALLGTERLSTWLSYMLVCFLDKKVDVVVYVCLCFD